MFTTPLGWIMRHPVTDGAEGQVRLLQLLTTGGQSVPRAADLSGLYFTYHGSHWAEDHYVVRTTTIKPSRGGPLSFVDHLRDQKTEYSADPQNEHVADGMTVFFLNKPHMIAFGEDNSIGFRLMIADHVAKDCSRIVGRMLGMTKGAEIFTRAVLMKRKYREIDEAKQIEMLAETGIKLFDDHEPQHREAFLELAKSPPKMTFDDPILGVLKPLAETVPTRTPKKKPKTRRSKERPSAKRGKSKNVKRGRKRA